MNDVKDNNYYYFIDYLRVVCCGAVMVLHLIINTRDYFGVKDIKLDMAFTVLFNICMFAVPVFLMITGFLLLDERRIYDRKSMYKYVGRITSVLLLFGTSFNIIEYVFVEKSFEISSLLSAICGVVIGKSWNHMWYCYMLLGIYILLPIIKTLTGAMTKITYSWFLIVLGIYNFVYVWLVDLFGFEDHFRFCSVYIFYLLLAFYIKKYNISLSKHLMCLVAVMDMILIFILVFIKRIFQVEDLAFVFGYSGITVAILAVCVFNVFRMCNWERTSHFVKKVSDYSFGIYIIHMVYINFIVKFLNIDFFKYGRYSLLVFLMEWLTVFVLSFFSVAIMKSIPLLKKII